MGKIIKNGVVYGGKTTIAGNISYDNTSSRLNSSTVQNAITELKELADAATSQVTTLPTASAANLNKIYQYIGATDANYTNGMFYKCVYDTSVNPAVYKWQIIDTSASSADEVTYDNTNSGLTTANVQAAIDELNANDVGKTEYVSDIAKGEIFNKYSGNGKNSASGDWSHAEGYATKATKECSHAEGIATTASGQFSHAEGAYTYAFGLHSHAEGYVTQASGKHSHAGGLYTIANTDASTAIGQYNVADGTGENDPKHLFIIGNGTGSDNRSNILEVSDSYLNVNGNIKKNGVSISPLVYDAQTESFVFGGVSNG